MSHALFCCNSDLFSDDCVCALICTMLCSIRDGECVNLCLLEEFNCIHWVCVCRRSSENVVLNTSKNSKFTLYCYTSFVCILYNFPCKFDVFLEWKRRTVDHDRCISAVNCCLTRIEVLTMVKMKCNRNRGINSILLYCCSNVSCSNFLVFKSCVLEVCPSTHEAVCKVCTLKNGCTSEHFMDFNDCLCLSNCVYVECTLSIAILVCCIQDGFHRY